MTEQFFKEVNSGILVKIKAVPNSSKNEICGLYDNALKVKIKAPAVENKANEELIKFFEESLAPYTFWKSDREKHIFALRTLVGELNGTYNRRISQFVLEMLENGSSLELVGDMMANIQAHKTSTEELDKLLEKYKTARAASKEA